MKKIILLFALFGLLIADIGPSPEPPDITVNLVLGPEDLPYNGYTELTYVCETPTNETESPVGQREISFACTEGTCYNTDWFYKLNPCFSGEPGHFEYEFAGEQKQTESMTFTSEQTYELYLEVEFAELTQVDNSNDGDTGLCAGAVVLLLLGLAFARFN